MKAFPIPSYVNSNGETHDVEHQGMDLRDYFAGQALIGLVSINVNDFPNLDYSDISKFAYSYADAMMEARK